VTVYVIVESIVAIGFGIVVEDNPAEGAQEYVKNPLPPVIETESGNVPERQIVVSGWAMTERSHGSSVNHQQKLVSFGAQYV